MVESLEKDLKKIFEFIKIEKERFQSIKSYDGIKREYIDYFINSFLQFCTQYSNLIINVHSTSDREKRDDYK